MSDDREKTAELSLEGELPAFSERYLTLQKLAVGGMAEVFLARDLTQASLRLVVVKRILPVQAKNPEYQKMFHDEGRLASMMSHPNVVRVFELGRSAAGAYIVMEYLAGQDLYDLVRRARRNGKPVPWQLAVAVAAQAAEGIAYAHQLKGPDGAPLNIIHRDITPSNIFVTWDGLVKVLDFGIAHAEQRLAKTQTGTVKGKAQYLAPEQITVETLDGRVDQFALAVVLFELLAERAMFVATNELAALNAILDPKRPSLREFRPEAPEALEAIISRAVSLSRSDRFADMAAFAEALRSTLDAPISRESIAAPLRQIFPAEFESHASLMGKFASSPTTRVPTAPKLPTLQPEPVAAAHQPLELPPLTGETAVPVLPSLVTSPSPAPGRVKVARRVGESPLVSSWAIAAGAVVVLLLAVGAMALRGGRARTGTMGSLILRSDPPGAKVVIDGTPHAYTTPFVLDHVSVGKHRVEMKFDGRTPFTAEVDVIADTSTTIEAPLNRPMGMVIVRVSPANAHVRLDSADVSVSSGQATLPVSVGERHLITVEAEGYDRRELPIEARLGETMNFDVRLTVTGSSEGAGAR